MQRDRTPVSRGSESNLKMLQTLSVVHASGGGPLDADYAFLECSSYFNRQSAMVNGGLSFGFTNRALVNAFGQAITSAQSNPMTDLGLSAFATRFTSSAGSKEQRTTEAIARRLLTPPSHAFVHGVLSLSWVIGAVGAEHFERREPDGRLILSKGSELRTKAKALGLPAVLREWLCGDEIENSGSEEGMLLSKEFFEKEL